MRNVSFCRLILYGRDIHSLKTFYQQHFGFSLVEEIPGQWVVLNAGKTEIAFHKIGNEYVFDNNVNDRSNAKLVFEVVDSIVSMQNELLKAGVKMKGLKTFEGFPYLYCDGEDIEGNIFQLMQKMDALDHRES